MDIQQAIAEINALLHATSVAQGRADSAGDRERGTKLWWKAEGLRCALDVLRQN